MIKFVLIFIIINLIFTNAVTDASNAISTLVGSRVIEFKKAARISAIFNFLGVVIMSFINISVADCISSVIILEPGKNGQIALITSMLSVIVFALIAMKFGKPTSETHALIAGLTGSGLAIYGIESINFNEWTKILVGLVWSIMGTYFISITIYKILEKVVNKMKIRSIKISQLVGSFAMSFMHGAQDGQKFIGILIIYTSIISKNAYILPKPVKANDYIWIILLVASVMGIGVSIGGKKIVDNIGKNLVELNNKNALLTDISTVVTLFVASILGLPVSTTHAKTVSIIGIGKSSKLKLNSKEILNIIKTWIWTFPICGIISYILTKILI